MVKEIGTYRAHTNAHIVTISAALSRLEDADDLTQTLKDIQRTD